MAKIVFSGPKPTKLPDWWLKIKHPTKMDYERLKKEATSNESDKQETWRDRPPLL